MHFPEGLFDDIPGPFGPTLIRPGQLPSFDHLSTQPIVVVPEQSEEEQADEERFDEELVEEEQVEDGRILLEQLGVGEKIMAGGQLLSNDRCQLLWVGHLCQIGTREVERLLLTK